jgi:hypothetical protein
MMSFRVLISAPYMLAVIDRFRRRFERLGIALSLAEVRERLESMSSCHWSATLTEQFAAMIASPPGYWRWPRPDCA